VTRSTPSRSAAAVSTPPADDRPVDATTVPREIRREALNAAMLALEAYLAKNEMHLDALARLELLDMALDDLAGEFEQMLVN
jgi:hypothetical protein